MAYSADVFVADEQPTTAKWNKLWTNDASFNDGTGIAAGAITPEKLLAGAGTAWDWDSYTPTWTGSGSNPAIGNGTLAGWYKKIGKTVGVRIFVLAGGTTTYGSGNYAFALPANLPAISSANGLNTSVPLEGSASVVDSGGNLHPCQVFPATVSTVNLRTLVTLAGANPVYVSQPLVTPSVPIAFGSADIIGAAFSYESDS